MSDITTTVAETPSTSKVERGDRAVRELVKSPDQRSDSVHRRADSRGAERHGSDQDDMTHFDDVITRERCKVSTSHIHFCSVNLYKEFPYRTESEYCTAGNSYTHFSFFFGID